MHQIMHDRSHNWPLMSDSYGLDAEQYRMLISILKTAGVSYIQSGLNGSAILIGVSSIV